MTAADRKPGDKPFFVRYRRDLTNQPTSAIVFGDGKYWPEQMRGRMIYSYEITEPKFVNAPLELLLDHFDRHHAEQKGKTP